MVIAHLKRKSAFLSFFFGFPTLTLVNCFYISFWQFQFCLFSISYEKLYAKVSCGLFDDMIHRRLCVRFFTKNQLFRIFLWFMTQFWLIKTTFDTVWRLIKEEIAFSKVSSFRLLFKNQLPDKRTIILFAMITLRVKRRTHYKVRKC